jgi:hypothetical protein
MQKKGKKVKELDIFEEWTRLEEEQRRQQRFTTFDSLVSLAVSTTLPNTLEVLAN